MKALVLPDLARTLLKGAITSLAHAGVITFADCYELVALLGLADA